MAADLLQCCTFRSVWFPSQKGSRNRPSNWQSLRPSHLGITELNWPLQLTAALPIAWLIMAKVCFILAVAAVAWY